MGKKEHAPSGKEFKQPPDTFSVYPPGHVNKDGRAVMAVKPLAAITIDRVYEFIKSDRWAGNATRQLREIKDHEANSRYKMLNFYFATFSSKASYRKASCVESATNYVVIDIDCDDLMKRYDGMAVEEAVGDLKRKLIADQNLTTVMAFTSPNGNGLKAVLYVTDHTGMTHREKFDAIGCYILQRYGVQIDKSGSDICRACFLPYDPECYVHPHLDSMKPSSLNLSNWLDEKRKEDAGNKAFGHDGTGQRVSGRCGSVYELVESWVSRDVSYSKGTYNRYVCMCGYLLCEFGVPEGEAQQWATMRFNDYRSSDVVKIISSCYRCGQFGKRKFYTNTKKSL